MLLAIDVGNTSTKFGVFSGEKLTGKFSIATGSSPDDLAAVLTENLQQTVDTAIVCSVVPEALNRVGEVLRREAGIEPTIVTGNFDFGMKVRYEPLGTLGTDRLVNSFAAAEKYGVPCIVCSFGTATTIDAVSRDRDFLGGLIAPGFRTMARSLHFDAAQLGEVEAAHTGNVLNQTTETSIQAGIFFSQIGLVETAVTKMKKKIGNDATVVATGGFGPLAAAGTSEIGHIDDNLTLEGLRLLHQRVTG